MSSAITFSTTMLLLLTSVYGNHTIPVTEETSGAVSSEETTWTSLLVTNVEATGATEFKGVSVAQKGDNESTTQEGFSESEETVSLVELTELSSNNLTEYSVPIENISNRVTSTGTEKETEVVNHPTEQFEENEMEHFSQFGSTLCELCNKSSSLSEEINGTIQTEAQTRVIETPEENGNLSDYESLKEITEFVGEGSKSASESTWPEENTTAFQSSKRVNMSSAISFSTTMMLLLTSVYGNHTNLTTTATEETPAEHTTLPAIYVDLPIFLPNETTSTHFETEPPTTSPVQHQFVRISNDNATETLILFINGPNDESVRKLNGSKWIRILDHAAFTHKNQSIENETTVSLAKIEYPKNVVLDECNKEDFEKNDKCFCAIDSLLSILKQGDKNASSHLSCTKYLKVNGSLVLGNETEPHVRTKRSYMFGKYDTPVKREVVDYSRGFFNDDFKIENTESRIYTLPGSEVIVPCLNRKDLVEYNRYMQYSWLYEDEIPISDNHIQENTGSLVLDNVLPKDSGNYTCIVKSRLNEKANVVQKHFHNLVVISSPIYKISTSIMYALRDSCELTDGDIISLYLPNVLDGLLCGYKDKMCSVEVWRPVCVNREEEKLLNATFVVTMFSLDEIVPTIDNTVCDINCQMQMYSKLAAILVKNIENFCKLPILSKLPTKEENFSPKDIKNLKNKEKGRWSTPPRLVIICPGGFGVEKKEPKICVVCPKNTYNGGKESYCKSCPAGQYQPVTGSKSCITCSSPLENAACLRVLYSNTEYFQIYVGVAFGIVLLIIVTICYCTRNSNYTTKGRRHDYMYNILRRDADLEQGVHEPLLRKGNRDSARKNTPPKLPPPDF